MITLVYSGMINKYRGLSTDTKPTGKNGDEFLEIDTGKLYCFDEESDWTDITGAGGSGGSGSGGGLLIVDVAYEDDGDVLSMTWREIYNALESGKVGFTRNIDRESTAIYMCPIMWVNSVLGEYKVTVINPPYNEHLTIYTCDSADGYPKYVESD